MDIKGWISLITPVVCFALTLWVVVIWFGAFFNNDSVLITINDYGERDVELICWFILIPILGYGTILNTRKVFDESFRIRKG